MRKLRAWDEANKIMHNDFQCIKSGNEGNDWVVFTSDKQTLQSEPHPLQNPYFQKQLIVMEGLGKKDKNGKEYFMGDIVGTDTIIQYVDYNEDLLCFGVRQFLGGATMDISSSWEIIGNIYENANIIEFLTAQATKP